MKDPDLKKSQKEARKEKFFDLWNQNKVFGEVKRSLALLLSVFIYGMGLSWFVNGLDLSLGITIYTGGITGLSQIIYDFIRVVFGYSIPARDLFLSIFIIAANIPLLILGWFGISKRFAIYSLVFVIVQSLMLGVLPKPITGLETKILETVIVGGILMGVGIGIALRFGISTGGIDILTQYLALRKGVSFGMISLILNLVICIVGGLLLGSLAVVAYTALKLVISTLVTDRVHTGYNFQALNIITRHREEVVEALLHKIVRGVTIIKVIGAYTKEDKYLIYIVISSYELTSALNLLKKIDPNAFITVTPVKSVHGFFIKKTIA